MKELILNLLSNNAVISLIATILASVLGIALQYLIERIQNQSYRNAVRKVVPIAKDLFFIIEKEFAKKKLPNKHLQKAQVFEEKFNQKFEEIWGRYPSVKEKSIAKQIVAELVEDLKKNIK